jgi:hypothetical protein
MKFMPNFREVGTGKFVFTILRFVTESRDGRKDMGIYNWYVCYVQLLAIRNWKVRNVTAFGLPISSCK